MAKEKKTIIFIVEGSSDKAALENIFKKIYRRNKEIDFGFTNGDITSDPTVTIANVENRLYRDKIILSEQTQYQKIVVTKHKDDLRLFINGNIQFSSMDEYRYHEALVHIPMSLSEKRSNILILGGGDGLAARELLKYSDVDKITLVDLDEEIIKICSTNNDIVKLNEGALENNKVNI